MKRKKHSEIGSFETVFNGVLFEVRQAPVSGPRGEKGIFEVVHRRPSVIVLALDEQEKLLLNHEYRPKFRKRVWRLPGGSVLRRETAKRAAQRELQEESGFKARRLTLFHKAHNGQTLDWNRLVFLGRDLVSSKLPEDFDEDITTEFLTLREAIRLVEKGEIAHDLTEYLIYKLSSHLKNKK